MTRGPQPGVDNFEMQLTRELRGYCSSLDPTTLGPNFMVKGSQNVYKDTNGNIANRFGRKLVTGDSEDSTIATVNSAYIWNTSLGAIRRMRVSNSKLQVASDIVTADTYLWYDLMTSLTKTRFVFDPIWDGADRKDKLVFVMGDLNIYSWSGGITTASSGTVNTITKEGSDSWAAVGFAGVGTVTINGIDYTYTGGSTTTTLTGVGTDASGLTAGLVAIAKVITTAKTDASGATDTMICDFIKVIDTRLHVGSYTSNTVGISKNSPYTGATRTDFVNFTIPATRVAGSPELLTLDNTVNGIGVRQGKAHISAGTSDWYIITYSAVTNGTTVTEQTDVAKQESSNQAAAYAHEFIDTVNDTIVYLSKDQQLRAFGTFRNLTTPAYPILSIEVSTELQGVDFTGGHIKAVASGQRGDLIYITAPLSGAVYIHQTKTSVNSIGNITAERLWFPPFIWGLSRIDVLDGITIGFSNANPQTYTLWDTGQWHDDTPSGNVPFISILLMSYRSFNRRQGKFEFDKIFWEGYMTTGTTLVGGIYYDYQGATNLASPIIHDVVNSPANNQSFFTGSIPPSLGDSSLGDNPLGSETDSSGIGATTISDHDLLPKFRIITGVQLLQCFEYALMCYSQSLDARWEMIALGANTVECPMQAVEIIKRS